MHKRSNMYNYCMYKSMTPYRKKEKPHNVQIIKQIQTVPVEKKTFDDGLDKLQFKCHQTQ